MKRFSRKGRITFALSLLLLAALLIAALLTFNDFGKVYEPDLCLASPDGRYRLVIREWGTIGGTGAEVYIESDSAWWPAVTRHKISDTIADDCVYPFRDGAYKVSWESDRVVIRCYCGRQKEDPREPKTWSGHLEYVFAD